MKQTTGTSKPVASPHRWTDEMLEAQPSSSDFVDLDDDDDEDSDEDFGDDTSFVDETEGTYSEYASSSEFAFSPSPVGRKDKALLRAAGRVTTGSANTAANKLRLPSAPLTQVQTTLQVPVASKKPGAGIHISNAMRAFLTRNHSDSNLGAAQNQAKKNDPLYNLIYRSESAEKLSSNDQSRMVIVHQDKPKAFKSDDSDKNVQKPKDLLQELLRANGCSNGVEPRSYKSLDDYFLNVTPDMITSYDMALMAAVRSNDLTTIQEFYRAKRNLQCCNRFHESIIHTAARRGSTAIMDFLLHTAKLKLNVVCDSGRTPLHDACWTGRPNFVVVAWILEVCPDFLLIADNKNFTPLDYVPKESYQEWCTFLTEHQTLLTPRFVV